MCLNLLSIQLDLFLKVHIKVNQKSIYKNSHMILKIRPTNTIITSQTLNTYRRKKTFGIFSKKSQFGSTNHKINFVD